MIDKFLIKHEFRRLQASNCIYIYDNNLILILYVDDSILFTPLIDKINEVKSLFPS